MQGDKMRQSGRTTLFVLVCIAVLTASYGVGLGVRKLRMAGFKISVSMGDDTEERAVTPEPETKVEPKTAEGIIAAAPEPSQADEPVEEAPIEEPPEEQPEPQAIQTVQPDLKATKASFQDLSDAERQKIMAQKRKAFEGKARGEGRGGRSAFQQLSEEDRTDFRSKMEALTTQARAGEISEEEMRQARAELFQEYGINPQARGGRRPGRRQ